MQKGFICSCNQVMLYVLSLLAGQIKSHLKTENWIFHKIYLVWFSG